MSDDGDWYREQREAQQERRAKRLPVRTAEIEELRRLGYKVQKLTSYQFRVDGVVDLYPIHHRVHWLKANRWGEYRPNFLKSQIEKIINS